MDDASIFNFVKGLVVSALQGPLVWLHKIFLCMIFQGILGWDWKVLAVTFQAYCTHYHLFRSHYYLLILF